MKRRMMRAAVALAVVASAGLLVSGTASAGPAGTVVTTITNRVVIVTAAPGMENRVTVEPQGGEIVIRDTADLVVPGVGCTVIDDNAVRCPKPFETVEVFGGDLDDALTLNGPIALFGRPVLNGEEGNDQLTVGPTGPGTIILGGPGNDAHRGGSGNDAMRGGPGEDGFSGGPGSDLVSYSESVEAVAADIDGQVGDDGEARDRDTIMTDIEALSGGLGDDTLIGSNRSDELYGGGGTDTLYGGPGDDELGGGDGVDYLHGEAGNDRLEGDDDPDLLFGEDGDDRLDGGRGVFGDNDNLSGGSGVDVADYTGRSYGVRLSIDGLANDGDDLEYDLIESDVERLWGGHGSDVLTAAIHGMANGIAGGPGNDTINTKDGDGRDSVDGQEGVDTCSSDFLSNFSKDGRTSCP